MSQVSVMVENILGDGAQKKAPGRCTGPGVTSSSSPSGDRHAG